MSKNKTPKKDSADNVKKLVPEEPKTEKKLVLPTLEFKSEFKVEVIMGPTGFKLDYKDSLHQNLAALLISRKVILRTKENFEDQKKTTKDGKLRKALQERLPRMSQALQEIDKMCREIYHMTAMSVLKEQLQQKNEKPTDKK